MTAFSLCRHAQRPSEGACPCVQISLLIRVPVIWHQAHSDDLTYPLSARSPASDCHARRWWMRPQHLLGSQLPHGKCRVLSPLAPSRCAELSLRPHFTQAPVLSPVLWRSLGCPAGTTSSFLREALSGSLPVWRALLSPPWLLEFSFEALTPWLPPPGSCHSLKGPFGDAART